MQTNRSIAIRSMSLLFGVKAPKIVESAVVPNARLPATICVLHPRNPADAFKPMFIRSFAVGSVLPVIGFSKVLKSVVGFISINMINSLYGHMSCNVKPHESMSGVMLPINFKVDVPAMVKMSGLIANFDSWARTIPVQDSGLGIISQNLREFCMCNHSIMLPGLGEDCNS